MLQVSVLASGSRGNATWVEAPGGAALLIDAGIGPRVLEQRIKAIGRRPDTVAAILVTHEHSDHIAGLERFAAKHHVPVYASKKLLQRSRTLQYVQARVPLTAGKAVDVCGLRATPIPVPHDAIEPFAFRIEAAGVRFGYVTDIGTPTPTAVEELSRCHALVVEFNHDRDMLENGPYDPWLKERIRGRRGHLSNDQGAHLLSSILHKGCRDVFLAHLSEQNNEASRALEAADWACEKHGFAPTVRVARQEEPSELVPVRDGRRRT
jgi:phosphoribosyl 1,2-cyclic phosphodiesterase